MKRLNVALFALLSLLFGQHALAEFTGFYPSWGYPGQIIEVQGTDLGNPTIEWDGSSIPTALASGVYFQIPQMATAGRHNVVLISGPSRSRTYHIEVNPLRSTWPRQRIEDVAINTLRRDLTMIKLTASIANGDANSRVKVSMLDDVGQLLVCDPCATEFFSARASDFFNQEVNNPSTYGYPVYHYASFLVTIPPVIGVSRTTVMGRTLIVEVLNRDGSSSYFRDYKMPLNHALLDSDNDGLLDSWETDGFPIPTSPEDLIDLRAMGCNPKRKDILVEVDWMLNAIPPSFLSPGNLWNRISEVYLNAPVLNPDGSTGIHLHIDRGQDIVPFGSSSRGSFIQGGQNIPTYDTLDFGQRPPDPRYSYIDFCELKSTSFDPARHDIFHYCVIGVASGNNRSGRAESPGNGFIVTTVRMPRPEISGSVEAMIGSFVHELGHNLGLHHGGIIADPAILDDSTRPFDWQLYVLDEHKPNQPSSMNSRYHLRGIDHDCDLCPDSPAIHGYSEGMLRDVDERNVNETEGICNHRSIDFLHDGSFDFRPTNTNGNASLCGIGPRSGDTDITDIFRDYDEWGNLLLNWKSSRLFTSPPAWSWHCR